jgi:hypothetical protein
MLQLTKTAQSGVTVTDAIHKVIHAWTTSEGECSYIMAMLVNASATVPVETATFNFIGAPGTCLFDQCYAHAMTLPEYAGATTV